MQGTYRGNIKLMNVDVHIGKQDGKDHGELSFYEMGDMHNAVKETRIAEGTASLVFDLNGFEASLEIREDSENCRGVFVLPSLHWRVETEFCRVSGEPDFKAHYFEIPRANLENLRRYDAFVFQGAAAFTYELCREDVRAFFQAEGICSQSAEDFTRIRELMAGVCAAIRQDGTNYTHDREHEDTISQYQWAKAQGNVTNCRGLAVILAGLLRSDGFKANLVECRPIDAATGDIHVVCEVFVPSLAKTVALDPSNNAVYYSGGKALSLFELRQALAGGQDIRLNADAHHGRQPVDPVELLAYMSKNLFYLVKMVDNAEDAHFRKDNTIALRSAGLEDLPCAGINTNDVKRFYSV